MANLRDKMKKELEETDVPVSIISVKSGVPYGALNYFKTKGTDMQSKHLEKLYKYFTGKELLEDESQD